MERSGKKRKIGEEETFLDKPLILSVTLLRNALLKNKSIAWVIYQLKEAKLLSNSRDKKTFLACL